MTLLIAPSEPAVLRALGQVSSLCEELGVDFLLSGRRGKLGGVQRKELGDFVSSANDGRLAKEVAQMSRLHWAGLILEGTPRWVGGALMDRPSWSIARHQGALLALQSRAIHLLPSGSIADTIEALRALQAWWLKDDHGSLVARPKPKDEWGSAGQRGEWLLSGLPGVSATLARRIVAMAAERYGRSPVTWQITFEDLLTVEGVGKKRAAQIWSGLEGGSHANGDSDGSGTDTGATNHRSTDQIGVG